MVTKTSMPQEARMALQAAATLVVLGSLIGDMALGILFGFIVAGLLIFAMTRLPLRQSLLGITFFTLALPNPAEGYPTSWLPPFHTTGQAFLNHINTVDRGGILSIFPVSGLEISFLVLFLVYRSRRVRRATIDHDIVPVPRPLIELAYLSFATIAFTWGHGLLTGGNFGMSLWQVNAVLYLPIIFLLFQAGMRGPEDHWALARAFLLAGAYKSGLAVFVTQTIKVDADSATGSTKPVFGTSHQDSTLFAFCFVIIIAGLLEQVDRRWRKLAMVMLPILLLGTQANNRRLAWVELGLVLFLLYTISRETRLKRFLRRAVMVSVPVAIGYVMAGWNSQYGGFFKPVRMIRSVVDAKTDGSSQWREYENVNIIATFWDHPLMGTGYGHPFKEVIVLPDIAYLLEPYLPHNSLLAVWGFTGLVGFAGLTLLWVAGLYFAMRAYHAAKNPQQSTAAIAAIGAFPIYLAQSWGDLGLGAWSGELMMGIAIAMAGKLAVATQQWSGGALWTRRRAR